MRDLFRLFRTKVKKNRKTILVFLWKDLKHPYAGGGTLYAFKQAEKWQKQGFDVIFVTPRFKGSDFEDTQMGSKVYRIGGKYTSYLLFPLWYLKVFRKVADYIVDIENGIPYFTPLYSRKLKIMLTFHIQKEVLFKELPAYIAWFPYLLEVYLMPLVYRRTKIVTICEGTKKDLQSLGFKPENISISYCGLDLPKKREYEKFKKPTMLYLGRIEKYKRVDLLIDMFERMSVPESELIIAGGGRALDQVKERANKSPIKDQIKILGRVTEEKKFELYGKTWLCATASEKEGWGMTVIEGNSVGSATLGFNISGLSESIIPGFNGLLANSEQDFVEKGRKVLAKQINFKNLQTHAEKFTWNISSQKTLDVLTNGRT